MKPALGLAFLLMLSASATAYSPISDGWQSSSPREEIQPAFGRTDHAKTESDPELSIDTLDREGTQGSWKKAFRITGGSHYRFSVLQTTKNVPLTRRSAIVKITWQDATGRLVANDNPTNRKWLRSGTSTHRPDYPMTERDAGRGWTEVSDTYRAPTKATQALVELIFRWAPPRSSVRWKKISLDAVAAPQKRIVRLASVHFQPRTKERTLKANREAYAPLVAEAAEKNADFVVLGETIGVYATGKTYAEVSESIPGPSTEYFGKLAKQHDLYLVVGLNEREKHLIYNVAVLIGPDGKVVGKYRKTCLPRGEADGGITPGDSYPVFQTRFGKVGMMVCYDAFFPEVARQLTINGAEVIALPVWGCNPELAAARATENHVYLVSSTYTDHNQNWIKTAIFNHEGTMIRQARKWGEVIVAEVDLNARTHWHGLGDFKARIDRARPQWTVERP